MASKNFVLFFLLFFFISCDPAVEYNHVIENDSDFEVKVLTKIGMWYMNGTDTIYSPIDTIIVNKNTSKIIYTSGGVGSVYSYQNCNFPYDSIPMIVSLRDSVRIIPNINNMEGWMFHIIKEYRNGGGVCECRMNLTNEMLTK